MVADDVAAKLVTAGTGTLTPQASRTLFVGSLVKVPTGAGPYTSLRDTGGSGPDMIQNKATSNIEYPMVQIRVRAADPAVCYAKAKQMWNVLVAVKNEIINGTFYLRMKPMQEPADDGLDDTGQRVQFVFNVMAMKRP